MNKKGLVLLSGGLDSTLAAKVMLEQGVKLEAINFSMVFHSGKNGAEGVSKRLGINFKIKDITHECLDIVKNPRHGYGKNINPCIDCRIFMLKKAKEYMKEAGASFIVTGEVLGERPMSQRSDNIRLIEKEAGLKGLIVRPLSAKLLEPSIPEKEGIVNREKLLDIRGRSRKPQMELAKRLRLADYPNPAGGCLLTDRGFSNRVKDLLDNDEFTPENIELLKVGRHFRLSPKAKLVVGRNREENDRLLKIAITDDMLFDPKGVPGPIGLLRRGDQAQDVLDTSCSIILRYSDNKQQRMTVVYWKHPDKTPTEVVASPATEEILVSMRL